jgi:hypothetical protein
LTTALAVDPQMVGRVWFRVREWIITSLRRGGGDITLQRIESELACGLMLLWLGVDGKNIVSAGVTQLTDDKICTLVAYGGRREDHLLETIEHYARDEGCKRLRIYGRKGWQRVLPHYRQPYIILERELA